MIKHIGAVVLTVLLLGLAACAPPSPSQTLSAGEGLPSFSAVDADGSAVDSSIFAAQRLTMVNFWATYCGPCIREMPDLGLLSASMPEGTRLIGVVLDAGGNEALARNIVRETGAAFTHIFADNALLRYGATLVGVPTTVFVDSRGAFVGEPLLGVQTEAKYRDEILKRLELVD